MRQVGILLLMLWVVMVGAIIAVSTVPIGHVCFRSLLVRNELQAGTGSMIMDYRTAVSYNQPFTDPYAEHGLSPDRAHEFYVEISSNGYYSLNLMPPGQRNNSERIYSSLNAIIPGWSVDSTRLFVYEYMTQLDSHISLRFFTVDIQTGEILQDYSPVPRIVFQSPDYHYLYVQLSDTSDDAYQIASIDTLTGTITPFNTDFSRNNHHWSPDGNWLILQHADSQQFSVVDPQTGNPHPVINAPVDGSFNEWTDYSLWFSRMVDSQREIWRVSLEDNSQHPMYQNGDLRWISNDDQWAIIHTSADDTTNSFLYNTVTGVPYPDLTIRNADFSSDTRCLVAQVVDLSGDMEQTNTVIYDLRTMQPVFIRENVRRLLRHDWYGEN